MKPNTAQTLTFSDVVAARSRLAGAIHVTPCGESAALSALTGSRVFLKREYLQRTGSFKERGARNVLAQLTAREARRGVVAASAGNHALGLAWHGRALGIPVTVVMPRNAPRIKIDTCRQLGARVVLHGDTFDEARLHAQELEVAEQLTSLHPFDDARVMAGQGTLALEILEQVPDVDAVLVPVGGGGLLAGVATALRALRPRVQIIGVEPEHAPSFSQALFAGRPVRVATRSTLADGLAVAEAGRHTFAAASALVDRVVTVREEALALAVWHLAALEHAVVEGAGAAGLAALLSGALPELAGKRVVVPLTGGNIDPLRHQQVINAHRTRAVSSAELLRTQTISSTRPARGLVSLAAGETK